MRKHLLILAMAASVSAVAQEEYSCIGKIDYLQQSHTGTVHLVASEIYGNLEARKLCSLVEDTNGVNPEVCKGWLSKLLAIKAADKKVSVQYRDDKSCSTQPPFSSSLLVYSLREAG